MKFWMLRSWVFCCCALLVSLASAQAGNWKQIDDDDGIKVWKLEIPGKEMPGFRGEGNIDVPAEAIIDVIKDVAHHTQWMHRCSESRVIKQFDEDHSIIYNRTDTPWPVWDRDAVLETQITRSPDGKQIEVSFKNTTPSLAPSPQRVIRMPRLVGFYRVFKLGPSKSRVMYQVEVDVGGSLPDWVAERVARDMPYETISRLRERVSKKSK